MKKFLSFIILLNALCILGFSQTIERKSATLPQISEIKSTLKEATGWYLKDNDQWESSKNRIGFTKNYKVGSDNFNHWQLREITIKDKTYSLLIKQTTEGAYKYPELQMDYYTFDVLKYYVFEKSKLEKIIDTKTEFNKSYSVNFEILYAGSVNWYQYSDGKYANAMSDISSRIQTNIGKDRTYSTNLIIGMFPVIYEEKQLVRFLILDTYLSNFDTNMFDYGYYEVDYNTFYKFIRY